MTNEEKFNNIIKSNIMNITYNKLNDKNLTEIVNKLALIRMAIDKEGNSINPLKLKELLREIDLMIQSIIVIIVDKKSLYN